MCVADKEVEGRAKNGEIWEISGQRDKKKTKKEIAWTMFGEGKLLLLFWGYK